MKELNLDNPIFAFYVSVNGMSRQSAAQHLAEFKDNLSYDNITTWILPVQGESKVECVYPGKSMYNTPELENLIKEINERIELIKRNTEEILQEEELKQLRRRASNVDMAVSQALDKQARTMNAEWRRLQDQLFRIGHRQADVFLKSDREERDPVRPDRKGGICRIPDEIDTFEVPGQPPDNQIAHQIFSK